MKKSLKKILPDVLITAYRNYKADLQELKTKKQVKKDYLFGYKRFMAHSTTDGLKTREHLNAFLIKEYHAIEKGLALRAPRPGFGAQRIEQLLVILTTYINRFGMDQTTDITLETLREYLTYDKENNENPNTAIPKIEQILDLHKVSSSLLSGGTRIIKKEEILSTLKFDFHSFIKSRHSVRDFSSEPVDSNLILEALADALYTPSVCNRQAWKVYLVDHANIDLKQKFLSVQNGNKGFGEHISSLLVITGKLSNFFAYERNQVFIDGGMFAMSVVLSLHSKGLGTCCLNTSYTADKENEFLNVMNMDSDCVPIMFIGVGHLKDTFKIAKSSRKSLNEIVEVCR